MKKLTKIFALVLSVVMLMALATACGEGKADADSAYIKENGKMVIGYTIYEPMNYEENGVLTGFDTEFAEAVCAKLGVEPEFVVIDWDNKFLELDSKSIDCIWNGMTITEEAKKNASVSKAYVKNAQVVVMSKSVADNYKTADDLKGLKFVAEAGSAGEAAIKDNGLDEKYVAVAAQTDALLEVKSGSADACVIDITMANAMTGEGTDYDKLTSVCELTTEEYGIAFRKDSDLTESVNAIMDELKADGTLVDLAEKYSLTLAF
jgi:polar amino acid transport system substrate-binding protein